MSATSLLAREASGRWAPREVVIASAGSGKTFHISSRILALLAHDQDPEGILASTFTRKAAGQILERVLDRMAAAALSRSEAGELARFATLDADRPVPAEPAFWALRLERLARALHRVNVGTLDAFFVGAARAFVHELGLPRGWTIADETRARRLRSEALQRVLATADPGEMVELLRLVNRGDITRSVHDRLLDELDRLLAVEVLLDPRAPDPWEALGKEGRAGGKGSSAGPPGREEGEALAEALDRIPVPATKAGMPRKDWARALERASATARAGDWEAFACDSLCTRALSDPPAFSGVPLTGELCALAMEGFALARRALQPELARQVAALGRLTRDFGTAYRALQVREGAFRFDDVTRLLAGSAPLEDRDVLYYRLDGRIRHILLDEFQDTSLAQWDALSPLVDEVLSDPARAGVVVADPKQSIYGWRGGEPEIVHALAERYSLTAETLSRSWRSSPVVLDLVNAVFDGISRTPSLAKEPGFAEASRRWEADFVRHEAVHRTLPGHARVEVGPRDPGRSAARPLLCRRAAECVAGIHGRAPGATLAVLTRTNGTVARMILELRRLGVPVSGEGGTPLTDSAGCEAVLALLRLVDHPGDTVARYHVARSPLGEALGLDDPLDGAAASPVLRALRRDLVELGYGATIDRLVERLTRACDARELRRLTQLVERAHRYDEEATLRPGDFVRRMEAERVEDPATATVRVMTVYQAKGLEFDVVVLPDLDREFFRGGRSPLVVAFRPAPTSGATAIYPNPKKGLLHLFPEVETAANQQRAGVLRDAISAFYVGLTRAVHAVHVIVAADGERGPGTALTAARILRETLDGGGDAPPAVVDGDILYEAGDPDWYRAAGKGPQGATDPGAAAAVGGTVPGPAPRLLTRPRSRMLPRRSPSQLEGGTSVLIADVLRMESGPALERGSVVHAWFERVGWIEDGLPEPRELRRLARAKAPDMPEDMLERLIVQFRSWTGVPAVRRVLSREAYPAGSRVEREVAFVHREGDTLVEGFIDRLVLVGDGDRVIRADIVDFKTDRVGSDAARMAERVALYAPQLLAYTRAVRHLFRLPASAVSARLLFVEAGVETPVEGGS